MRCFMMTRPQGHKVVKRFTMRNLLFLMIMLIPSEGLQLLPTTVQPVTTCAATTCSTGSECRIVQDQKTGVIAPNCFDPNLIPQDASERRCGGIAGLPLLIYSRIFSTRPPVLRLYRCTTSCPADLVCRNGICCSAEVLTKPGQCPAPQGFGTCAASCQTDAECRGTLKCCRNACGGTACVVPQHLLTCANVKCQRNFQCVETPDGPNCVPPPKQGECPLYPCAPPPRLEEAVRPPVCNDTCYSDSECPGTKKCCHGCSVCKSCHEAFPRSSCQTIDCQPGFICIDTKTGPKCILSQTEVLTKPGQCPAPQGFGTCAASCQIDAECRGTLKCCTNACGGTACVVPHRLLTCANVKCQRNFQCVETSDGPTCVPTPKQGECPLYPCAPPPRYEEPVTPPVCNDTCYSDSECPGTKKCCHGCSVCKSCHEAFSRPSCQTTDCQSGFICIDTKLGPRCIMPQNVCELPSDSGPCLAYIPRYFYNSTSAKCEQFIYGGCQGNANRFTTEVDCYGTCGQCPFFPAVVLNCERSDTCSLTGPNVCPTNTKCCSTPCGNACLIPS